MYWLICPSSNVEQMHLNTFSVSLISLAKSFFMKARQLQMQFHKLLHLTSTHYTFEKISIFLPRSCRVIFQEKTKSSRELFSVLQSDVFSVTVVIRKNVFISELRKLIELLKHKPFLRKGCLRISFKWLRYHFDEIEIRFFALHVVESDMKW